MTREETKKAIEIMQAYVDGKEIEYYYSGSEKWKKSCDPSWIFFNGFKYRIKSEPKYRPYANAEEMDKAIQEHGSWVKNKATGLRRQIASYCDRVFLSGNSDDYYYDDMLKLYTWQDGTPCGIIMEE